MRRLNFLGCCLLALGLTSGGREPPALTLALAGDISLARGTAQAQAGRWPQTFAGVRGALQADLVLANLESPLTGLGTLPVTKGIDLRAPVEAVKALAPFTHLSVENNHALDGGGVALSRSLDLLHRHYLTPVTTRGVVQTVNGVRVALLAYLDDGAAPPLAEVKVAAQKAELVIVMPHWGAEYDHTTARQRQQANALAAAGADLIVGSGPHVLQGTERIGPTLVLYSLGNLLFDQPYPDTWRGAVVRVRWQGGQAEACAVPTFTRRGKVRLASGEDARKALGRLNLPACEADEGTE